MDIKWLILEEISKNNEIKVADIKKVTGFSRAYINDVFVSTIKDKVGTKVTFNIMINSKIELISIFREFTGGSFEFSKTKVIVKLFKMDSDYVSRSQARRILVGLEKFKTIILDFKDVKMVGQGFVDEIFRVWKRHNPDISVQSTNTNEDVDFMIKRVK
jgi:hypothetical protein